MGLAASQARLLSITQRMSDNELRAQLINNQKMRLSAESSQVSENYINALNKTNLVFANYDENDKAQNIPLTFNSLTAFNQYNNQYGLTNTAGNILISEREAELYAQSQGNLTEFLKKHGIEYTTSYWDTLGDQLADSDLQYDANALKIMYEGNPTATPSVPSYNDTIKTKEYNDFAAYADEFAMKMGELSNTQAEQASLQSKFISALVSGNSASPTTYTTRSLNATTADTIATNIVNNFNTPLPSGYSQAEIKNMLSPNFNEVNFLEYIRSKNDKIEKIGNNYYSLLAEGVMYSANQMVLGITDGKETILTIDPSTNDGTVDDSSGSSGQSVGTVTHSTFGTFPNNCEIYSFTTTEDGQTYDSTYLYKNIDPTTRTADVYALIDSNSLDTLVTYYIQDKTKEVVDEILKAGGKINTSGQACTDAGFTADEKTKLQNAAGSINGLTDIVNNIAMILFGSDASSYVDASDIGKSAQKLNVILDYLTSGTAQWQTSGEQPAGNDLDGNEVKFKWDHLKLSQNVFNAYVIDTMMDIFGEPVYGYLYTDGNGLVDNTKSNIDASAEAQWLINLFNKIKSCGYQMLPNGLASSTDWIQFALENGIVVMEQVNSDNNWQAITYNSCSDISEQTDSSAATIAEAEYNKAMRQIEAKDEMYDLELKNIDTEHSSLTSEYESVKKAMSGNIERTFQMYS